MRLKRDENIPTAAACTLQRLGHDVETVRQEGLMGESDRTVWVAAQSEKRLFVTQDMDFSDARQFRPGTHHGIMLIRLPSEAQPDLAALIPHWFALANPSVWNGAIIIATPGKLRVLEH